MIIKTNGVVISSPFGASEGFRSSPHTGIDIPLEADTILQTIADGVVTKVFDGSTAIGKGVAIKTKEGLTHIYGHLNQTSVAVGEKVHAGDVIGLSGNTGNVVGENGGYHLHFATQNPDGSFADPTHLADEIGAMATGDGGGIGSWAMDQFNTFSDWFVGKEVEFIVKPFMNFMRDVTTDLWQWFIFNLPDIMGYFTVGAGVFIILGAMIGKGGLMKPFGVWAGLMILAICILGGV